jgi:hypothetical protein
MTNLHLYVDSDRTGVDEPSASTSMGEVSR